MTSFNFVASSLALSAFLFALAACLAASNFAFAASLAALAALAFAFSRAFAAAAFTAFRSCLASFSARFPSSSLLSRTELLLALTSLAAFPAFFLAFLLRLAAFLFAFLLALACFFFFVFASSCVTSLGNATATLILAFILSSIYSQYSEISTSVMPAARASSLL